MNHSAIVQPGSNMCVCGMPDDHPVHGFIEDVPAEPMTNAELRRIVKKIGMLKIEQERLILKAHQEGASLREIAEILEVNHVTVRNALQKLSWRLANEKPPDDKEGSAGTG